MDNISSGIQLIKVMHYGTMSSIVIKYFRLSVLNTIALLCYPILRNYSLVSASLREHL